MKKEAMIKVNCDKPRILREEELAQITLEELEKNRVLMRDLEYTLCEALKNAGTSGNSTNVKEIRGGNCWLSVPTIVKEIRGGNCWFDLPDDDIHTYFFDDGWPIRYNNFLLSKDIIPSGHWVQKHRSAQEIREFAKELNMTVEEFWEEEYYCNPKVFKKIGVERAPFTKPLQRVSKDGKKERYNHRLSKWTRVKF